MILPSLWPSSQTIGHTHAFSTWSHIWSFLLPSKVNCSKFCPQGGLPFTTLRDIPGHGSSASYSCPCSGACTSYTTTCKPNLFLSADGNEFSWGHMCRQEGRKQGSRSGHQQHLGHCFQGLLRSVMSVPFSFDDGVLAGHTQIYGWVSQIAPKSWLAAQVE